jgi:hypothetical protein
VKIVELILESIARMEGDECKNSNGYHATDFVSTRKQIGNQDDLPRFQDNEWSFLSHQVVVPSSPKLNHPIHASGKDR